MKVSLSNSVARFDKAHLPNQFIIGRSTNCDFAISHESISRQHCLVESIDDHLFITDLGSSNGVFLNEEKIPSHTKTPFNRFDTIAIGSFDLQIDDDEPDNTSQETTIIQTGPTKKAEPKITKPVVVKKNQNNAIILIALLALGLIAYFLLNTESEPEIISVPETTPTSKEIKTTKIPNQFLTSPEYVEIDQKKNCQDELQSFCSDLKIADSNEGLFKSGSNFFVVLEGSEALTNFERILSSELMNQFFIQKNFQIHLILKNAESKITGVYRFHPKLYSPQTTKRILALELLAKAQESGDASEFWAYQKQYFPYRDLQE